MLALAVKVLESVGLDELDLGVESDGRLELGAYCIGEFLETRDLIGKYILRNLYLNLEGIEEGADNATIAEHLAANVQALADAFIFYEGNDVKLDEPFKIERNASEFTAQATAPYKGTANGDFVKGTVIADLFGTTAVNTLIDAPSEEMFNKLFLVYFSYVWDPKN